MPPPVATQISAFVSSETKEQLERALKSAPETAVLRSAFELATSRIVTGSWYPLASGRSGASSR